MCGISGVVKLHGSEDGVKAENRIREMTNIIRYRGPDDEGFIIGDWSGKNVATLSGPDTPSQVLSDRIHPYAPEKSHVDVSGKANFAFGHRRLSILDLSAAGHQPLSNADRTIWVVHNGEVYNFEELRTELVAKGYKFHSKTDTEVIVYAYEEWGDECVKRFNGMWAFAVLDLRKGRVFCSRDHFGIKPFYYSKSSEWFVFGSEIKSLIASEVVPRKPNHEMLFDYFVSTQADHSKQTFFDGVEQLRGGECLSFDLQNPSQSFRVWRYWEVHETNTLGSNKEIEQKFYELFEDSIRLRLISDVPVGACLSGGLDSSAIVCTVDKLQKKREISNAFSMKTFSARYHNSWHDEGEYIDEVLKNTSVEPHAIYPDEKKFLGEIDKLVYHQDEPFGSLSIFAQWNVFKLIHQQGIKVTLDGQGSDEAMAGYHASFGPYLGSLLDKNRFGTLVSEMTRMKQIHNYPVAQGVGGAIAHLGYRGPIKLPLRALAKAVGRVGRAASGGSINRQGWISDSFLSEARQIKLSKPNLPSRMFRDDIFEDYLYKITINPGLHHLLHFEDRNSMAHSIEARVPFLDHRLVEFIFSLPKDQKLSGGTTKVILRNGMKGVLPEKIRLRQDKIGFSTPQDVWFRKDLKGFLFDLFNSSSFKSRPYFDSAAALRLLEQHQDGKTNLSTEIWKAAGTELWLRQFVD